MTDRQGVDVAEPPALAGAYAKVEVARTEIFALAADYAAFMEQFKVSACGVLDTTTGECPIIVDGAPDALPLSFAVRIGGIVHHLRSSLDHLVWQLVLANGQTPTGRNQFPIYDKRAFNGTGSEIPFARRSGRGGPGDRSLEGVASRAVAGLELMQPYFTAGQVYAGTPGQHPLSELRELSNIDKHRLLHTVYTAAAGTVTTRLSPDARSTGTTRLVDPMLIENGRLIGHVPVEATGPHPAAALVFDMPLHVETPNAGEPVVDVLYQISETVELVLGHFEQATRCN